MPLRTGGPTWVVDDFSGINQVVDEVKLPPTHVRWSHGGQFTERKEFHRLCGKKAISSSSSYGSFLSIAHLVFNNRNVVVTHSSHSYQYEEDLSSLVNVVPDTSTLINSFLIP